MLLHASNTSNFTNGAMVHGASCKSHESHGDRWAMWNRRYMKTSSPSSTTRLTTRINFSYSY